MDVGTILLLAYLAGCMLALVPTARYFLRDTYGEPDTGDYVEATAMSMCFVWLWPLYIPGWWVVQLLKSDRNKV